MNIYEKLNAVKTDFHRLKIEKTGHNKFAGYRYFELADFLLPALDLLAQHRLCEVTSFTPEFATMTIVDIDEPGTTITITSPFGRADLKACHEVQNIGAVETYQRRYLWSTLLQLVEQDAVDATTDPADDPRQRQIADYRAQIKSAQTTEILKAIGFTLKQAPVAVQDAIRPAYVARQKALALDIDDLATTLPGGA